MINVIVIIHFDLESELDDELDDVSETFNVSIMFISFPLFVLMFKFPLGDSCADMKELRNFWLIIGNYCDVIDARLSYWRLAFD